MIKFSSKYSAVDYLTKNNLISGITRFDDIKRRYPRVYIPLVIKHLDSFIIIDGYLDLGNGYMFLDYSYGPVGILLVDSDIGDINCFKLIDADPKAIRKSIITSLSKSRSIHINNINKFLDFDKVLARNNDSENWEPGFIMNTLGPDDYLLSDGKHYKQCIHYRSLLSHTKRDLPDGHLINKLIITVDEDDIIREFINLSFNIYLGNGICFDGARTSEPSIMINMGFKQFCEEYASFLDKTTDDSYKTIKKIINKHRSLTNLEDFRLSSDILNRF